MAREWFISQAGKKFGSYSTSKLSQLAAAGKITKSAKVANSEDGPWHDISDVEGLEFPSDLETQPASLEPKGTSSSVSATQKDIDPNVERSVWTGRPSHLSQLGTYVLCVLFCWLIVPIFIGIWRAIQLNCLSFELTTQRFKTSSGVVARHTDELELYRVKDMSFSQSFSQRLLGLGTIQMQTSDTTTPVVTLDSLNASEAKEVREQIRTLTEQLRTRKRVREVDYV
jgi:membrane protein YdbS with pleckstrin-like domain